MARKQQTKIQRQTQVITRLKNENKKLRKQIAVLKQRDAEKTETIEYLTLQIEELKRIIFGGPKKEHILKTNDEASNTSPSPQKKRPPESYRRTTPTDTDITTYISHPLYCCPECDGDDMRDITERERYVEDILPLAEWHTALKTVTKHTIETGYCPTCKHRVAAIPIAPQTVSIGSHIRHYVTYAIIILRLSYQQVTDFLEGTMHIQISDGEIANILKNQSQHLAAAHERLKKRIRRQPGAHFDETGWKVQAAEHGNYAWVMTGIETTDTVFLLGRSRGKGNITDLRGNNNPDQIGISDDYGAYKNAFAIHALCWAHPHRKLRDLKNSAGLSVEKQTHCVQVYTAFAELYREIRKISADPFVYHERVIDAQRLMSVFTHITKPHPLDPLKLKQIKKRLLTQKERYFTCITHEGIPPDNNNAERALRHLVLKRKNCYGSRTQAGADRMSILYSVLLSSWWKSKKTFFQEYENSFA